MWRNAPEEERSPYVEREKVEREKYKIRIEKWREEYDERMEEQRKNLTEHPVQAVSVFGTNSQEHANEQYYAAPSGGYDPNMMAQQQAQQQQQYMEQQQQPGQVYNYQPQSSYPGYAAAMPCKLVFICQVL